MMRKFYLFVSLVVGSFLSSCVDDSYDLDHFSDDLYIPIQQVLPVGSSVVTVKDLLNELDMKGLNAEADGLVYFQYDTVTSFNIQSFDFELDKDTSRLDFSEIFPVGVSLPDLTLLQKIPLVAKLPITFSDTVGQGRLDSAEFKRVHVEMQIQTNVPGLLDALDLKVSMPKNLDIRGRVSVEWDKRTKKAELIMEDVWADLSKSDTLYFDCLAIVDGIIPLSQINEESYIEVVTSGTDLSYKRLYGCFVAQTEQSELSSIGIDVYDQEEGVKFDVDVVDPRLEVKVWTNSGVPINVGIESLVAFNNKGDREIGKFADGSSRYTLTMKPSLVEGEEVLGMNEVFDRRNGSIDKLINCTPDTVNVETTFFVNGKETGAERPFFLLDSTYVRLGVSAIVPIWLNAGSYISVLDTIKDIDIYEDVVDYEKEDYEVEDIALFLEVENGMPLVAEVDFTFLQEDTIRTEAGMSFVTTSELKDERFKQNIKLEAASLDNETNMALKPVKNVIRIDADKTMLDDIKKIKHIVVSYKVQVPVASASAKVYSHNLIKAKAYAQVKGNFSSGASENLNK